jgi:asparagine synthase (glutamine-hydrolysing)
MCGIAGIVAQDAGRHKAALLRMVAALRHRGPDGEGSHLYPDCALGHARLSIVDIAGGAQPMLAPDGKTAIVLNGEIYGYKELRAGRLRDYPFRTQSDTEVLLALYELERHRVLDILPGMFSFALWDDRRHELFCARDRFGEKPFFYATSVDGSFVFASELKAILASGLIDPVLDPEGVAHYLQYLYVHPHRTIYRNIQVLPPAHRLLFRDGRAEVTPYWTLPTTQSQLGPDDAVEQFRELLGRAVARQLVADVPVGAFLSGGLDSSTIVALAARTNGRCKTFSFGFGPVIDELPYARGLAERYGTEHTELVDQDVDIADLLVRMSAVYDEPFGDSSNIPTFLLCQMARQHVTVALAGEGADELLGGYSFWYRSLFNMERAGRLRAAARGMVRVTAALCKRAGVTTPDWALAAQEGIALLRQHGTPGAAHVAQTSYFTADEIKALVPTHTCDPHRSVSFARSLDGVLRLDLLHYLPGDILVKADRASMAHGLELRAPFLDWEFASFCLSLPMSLKVTRTSDKVILRQAFAEAWTPAIRTRGKQGFGAPVAHWLRRRSVQALKREVLGNPSSRIYDVVSRVAVAPFASRDDYRTWALLVLALWMEGR